VAFFLCSYAFLRALVVPVEGHVDAPEVFVRTVNSLAFGFSFAPASGPPAAMLQKLQSGRLRPALGIPRGQEPRRVDLAPSGGHLPAVSGFVAYASALAFAESRVPLGVPVSRRPNGTNCWLIPPPPMHFPFLRRGGPFARQSIQQAQELTSNICHVVDEQRKLLNGANPSDLSADEKDVYFQLQERISQLSRELNELGLIPMIPSRNARMSRLGPNAIKES
jgi:hypothetical protein